MAMLPRTRTRWSTLAASDPDPDPDPDPADSFVIAELVLRSPLEVLTCSLLPPLSNSSEAPMLVSELFANFLGRGGKLSEFSYTKRNNENMYKPIFLLIFAIRINANWFLCSLFSHFLWCDRKFNLANSLEGAWPDWRNLKFGTEGKLQLELWLFGLFIIALPFGGDSTKRQKGLWQLVLVSLGLRSIVWGLRAVISMLWGDGLTKNGPLRWPPWNPRSRPVPVERSYETCHMKFLPF